MVKLIFLMLAVLFCASNSLQAQKDLPPAVQTAFAQQFPDATDVEWEMEDDGNWEIEFELGEDESTATFNAEGKWLETETEIAVDDLPEAIRAALKGQKIREAARILKSDGATVYEVEIGNQDRLYDAGGKLLMEDKD